MMSDWYVFVLFLVVAESKKPGESTCHVCLAAHCDNCVCLLILRTLCAERQIVPGL